MIRLGNSLGNVSYTLLVLRICWLIQMLILKDHLSTSISNRPTLNFKEV